MYPLANPAILLVCVFGGVGSQQKLVPSCNPPPPPPEHPNTSSMAHFHLTTAALTPHLPMIPAPTVHRTKVHMCCCTSISLTPASLRRFAARHLGGDMPTEAGIDRLCTLERLVRRDLVLLQNVGLLAKGVLQVKPQRIAKRHHVPGLHSHGGYRIVGIRWNHVDGVSRLRIGTVPVAKEGPLPPQHAIGATAPF